jgi:hypothetical protein
MKPTQTGGIATGPFGTSFWIARIAIMTRRMSSVTSLKQSRAGFSPKCPRGAAVSIGQHTAALLRSPMLKKKRRAAQ